MEGYTDWETTPIIARIVKADLRYALVSKETYIRGKRDLQLLGGPEVHANYSRSLLLLY